MRHDSVAGLPALHRIAGLGAGIAVAARLMRWFVAQDNGHSTPHLMQDHAFWATLRGARPPELGARMAEFSDLAADSLAEDCDEVPIVGHSSGAYLGVSVLADLIRAGRVPVDGPALGFLTLGQVVPKASFLPDATRLRSDPRYLSARAELTWVDVIAPGIGCAFALCDPVAVSGVEPPDKRWPLVAPAAFTQTRSPERSQSLRHRCFRHHFLCFCAFDRPEDCDYFQITTGPKTLADRYENRPPSHSGIDRAVSKDNSTAA